MPLPLESRWAIRFLLILLLTVAVPHANTQQMGNVSALPAKESIAYTVEWRFIHAGNVRLNWQRTGRQSGTAFNAGLELESAGLVSRLYKVDNRYTVALSDQLCAIRSLLQANEGSRQRETTVNYDRNRRKATYVERDLKRNATVAMREVDTASCTHDVLGGLYYLRTLRTTPGQVLQVPVSDGKKSAQARVEVQEREQIATPAGKFQTIRHEVFLFSDVLYHRKGRLFVWLTDDARRLPVQIRIRLPLYIGTITLQLNKEEKS
jgi:hypothetical protein